MDQNYVKNGVSVIMCCYNSAKRLPETLKHLALQETDGIHWEVVLVDNNSTDETKVTAIKEWRKLNKHIDIKIIEELKPGLSYARKAGILAAQYNYCIFCDDDNWLQKDYIQIVYSLFEIDSQIGAVGGKGISTIEFPKWMNDYYKYFAIGSQGEISGDVTEITGCLYGAGLSVRKDVIQALYDKGFESLLNDRTGNSLMSGGDIELTYAIRLIGLKLYYSDSLVFYHNLRKNRTKFKNFTKLLFYIGYSWMALQPYHTKLSNLQNKYPAPNWKDALHLVSQFSNCFLSMIANLLRLNMTGVRNEVFKSIFIAGQLKFIKNNYGIYKGLSHFILNSNADIGHGLVHPDRRS